MTYHLPAEHESWKRLVDQLKARRKQLGLTQHSLANRIGITESLIGLYEVFERRPTGFTLAQWAFALGCTLILQPEEPPDARAANLDRRLPQS